MRNLKEVHNVHLQSIIEYSKRYYISHYISLFLLYIHKFISFVGILLHKTLTFQILHYLKCLLSKSLYKLLNYASKNRQTRLHKKFKSVLNVLQEEINALVRRRQIWQIALIKESIYL